MDTLYATYSMSPKCQRELSDCAKDLEIQILKIGRNLSVRWAASSYRSVKAVWHSYAAQNKHFCEKAVDPQADSMEKSKFMGLANKLENPIFIENRGLCWMP